MKVEKTTNYDKFKTMKGNRAVVMAHVKRLAEVMEEFDLSKHIPVLVNEKMEIIDGQHRVEALKMLNRPVYYVVAEGASLKDVQKLNNSTRSWKVIDYIESYIELGNSNYEILLAFMQTYGLSASISASLLQGTSTNRGGQVSVRMGTFVVKTPKRAKVVGEFLSKIKGYLAANVVGDRDFVEALTHVLDQNINRSRLAKKLSYLGQGLQKQAGKEDYLRELERIYNFKVRGERVRLF